MKAVLSDIHGNLEALEAVLADAADHGAQEIYCLGDVIGYGPDPCACLDLALQWDMVLLGNHEQAFLIDPTVFSPAAQRAARWTQSQLGAPGEAAHRRRQFLGGLTPQQEDGACLFVHGSPRRPLDEYVYPWIVGEDERLAALFQLVGHACFSGHTHIPGVITEQHQFLCPEATDGRYHLDSQKVLINVGSVGQPRDRDWRACYVLFDGMTASFRRVEYDLEKTISKMQGVSALAGFLAQRLREGR